MKIKKEAAPLGEGLSHLVTGEPTELSTTDKLAVMRDLYAQAIKTRPNYDSLKDEMVTYNVSLPEVVTVPDISAINKLYAITQSYLSRVTAVELLAIDNMGRWDRLYNIMEGYIEDREAVLILDESVQKLPNVRSQQAAVRTKLAKEYATFRSINLELKTSESFRKQIEAKKKDLASVLMNISRQVKALSIEHSLTH